MKYLKTMVLPILIIVLGMDWIMGCAQKPPTLTKIDPATASAAGGTEITITGTGFKAAPAPTVTIGGNPATGVKVTAKTTLKATVPAGVAGPADIVVMNAKAKVKSIPFKGFSYYEDVLVESSIPDVTMTPSEGIEPPAKVGVTFNQDVDPTSVVIKVTGADGAEIAGGPLVQDSTDTKMFTFAPAAPFAAGDYTVTVSGAKAMAAGNVMATDYTMSFKVKEANKQAMRSKGSSNIDQKIDMVNKLMDVTDVIQLLGKPDEAWGTVVTDYSIGMVFIYKGKKTYSILFAGGYGGGFVLDKVEGRRGGPNIIPLNLKIDIVIKGNEIEFKREPLADYMRRMKDRQ